MIGVRQLHFPVQPPTAPDKTPGELCADCAAFRANYISTSRQRGEYVAQLIRTDEHEKHALAQRMRLLPE